MEANYIFEKNRFGNVAENGAHGYRVHHWRIKAAAAREFAEAGIIHDFFLLQFDIRELPLGSSPLAGQWRNTIVGRSDQNSPTGPIVTVGPGGSVVPMPRNSGTVIPFV